MTQKITTGLTAENGRNSGRQNVSCATDGTLDYDRVAEERKMFQESGSDGLRNEFFEAELHYSRGFKHHHLGGTLKYNQSSKIKTVGLGDDLKQGIARRNQGLAGQIYL